MDIVLTWGAVVVLIVVGTVVIHWFFDRAYERLYRQHREKMAIIHSDRFWEMSEAERERVIR